MRLAQPDQRLAALATVRLAAQLGRLAEQFHRQRGCKVHQCLLSGFQGVVGRLYAYAKRGELPHVKIGRHLKFIRSDLERALGARRTGI